MHGRINTFTHVHPVGLNERATRRRGCWLPTQHTANSRDKYPEICTRNPSNRANADLRLRPHGHRDLPVMPATLVKRRAWRCATMIELILQRADPLHISATTFSQVVSHPQVLWLKIFTRCIPLDLINLITLSEGNKSWRSSIGRILHPPLTSALCTLFVNVINPSRHLSQPPYCPLCSVDQQRRKTNRRIVRCFDGVMRWRVLKPELVQTLRVL
jgi:hypothetical protein